MDCKGQVALEYLLMFFVFLMILSIITIPLIFNAVETSNDVITAIEIKSLLVEIQKNIKLVYSLDVESKRRISVFVHRDMKLFYVENADKKFLSTTLTFSDSSVKKLNVEVPCDVSFNGHVNNHYVYLKKSWYHNTEVKYIKYSNGTGSINVNFK